MQPSMKRLLFPLLLIVGLTIVAEASLRVLVAAFPAVQIMLSVEPVTTAIPDRALSWRGNPRYPGHDALGYRNRAVPPQADIVALGDSQTYGATLRADQTWPEQLERLGVGRTYNMGVSGWGPLQSFLVLDEALDRQPRLVVQALYLGNDLVDSFTFVYHRKRLTQFRSRDERLSQAIEAIEEARPWDNNPLADQRPQKFVPDPASRRPARSIGELIEQQSSLYGLWNAVWRAYNFWQRHPFRPEADDADDPLQDDDYLRFDNGSFRTVLTPSYRKPAVDLDDPRVAEGLRMTVEALDQMQARAEAASADFAVLLIPTKELALKQVVASRLGELPHDFSAQVSEEELTRQTLHRELAVRSIPTIDALPALQSLVESGALPYSETKDGHLNEAGQQAVATLVRGAVERRTAQARRGDG